MLSVLCTDMDYFSQLTTVTCAHRCTLRRQTPSSTVLSMAPAAPSCPQFGHSLCQGQSQSLPSSQLQLPPSHCWDNKYLTPEQSAGPGCSRLPDSTSRGGRLAGCWRRRARGLAGSQDAVASCHRPCISQGQPARHVPSSRDRPLGCFTD